MPLEPVASMHCPGDTIPYYCSIRSNSEVLSLIWHITLPGSTTIEIPYRNVSEFTTSMTRLDGFFNASIASYMHDEYIESMLIITVPPNPLDEQLSLHCEIENLGNASTSLYINSSSKQPFLKLKPLHVLLSALFLLT